MDDRSLETWSKDLLIDEIEALQAKLDAARLTIKSLSRERDSKGVTLEDYDLLLSRLDSAINALRGVAERCGGHHMSALAQLDTGRLVREVLAEIDVESRGLGEPPGDRPRFQGDVNVVHDRQCRHGATR